MEQSKTSARSTFRIAFIRANWHADIVDQCQLGFSDRLRDLGLSDSQVDHFTVPGAFEIPLHAKMLAESQRYDAIVGAAFVVDGGIYRHEFVANTVVSSLMNVQLETCVPVFSAVLTPHHFHESGEHHKYFLSHLYTKGAEAAEACVETIGSLRGIRALTGGDEAMHSLACV